MPVSRTNLRKQRNPPSKGRSRSFVPKSAQARSIRFDHDMMHVSFRDGRVLSLPLTWYPVLNNATPILRERYEILGGGISIHWPELDESLSIAGMLAGADASSL